MMVAAPLLHAAPPTSPPPYCRARAFIEGQPRAYNGVWFDGFEGERFFEGATSVVDLPWRSPRIAAYFRTREVFESASVPIRLVGQYHFYRVTFVGKAWHLSPNPVACLPMPPGPGASEAGITVMSVSRFDDLGEARKWLSRRAAQLR